ncbi:major facilitator superfamily transporter [Colletotrichum tamarilloi]|uniref:Major facilitator superfamily transporter n=1 Tax=Colletotrichum tamarilloi TaxID=1209934 RepID=A0ABQ9QQ04_9PEZI|nr:major facilitator superfamily transporter [Colletotrichum tamarilloi]KAK1480917.1 major facilitator superfamily transporter [Colletotrichum tamarilloi]
MDRPTSRSSRELTKTRFTSPASAMTQPSTTPIVLNMSEKPLPPSNDSDVEQTDKKESGTEDEGSTAADQEEAEEEYIEGLKLIIVLAALTLTVFLMMLDMSIITTAVPEITTAFNSLSDVGCAALQPLAGKLYTHRHSKEIFLAFLFVFEAGSLICALSNSSTLFIIGRAVSGMGSGGLFNGSLTIIGATVPLEKRPLIIGIMIGISNIGIVAGPLVGGALTQYTTWRWCFYINLPIGAVTAAMLFLIHIPSKITKPVSLVQIPRYLDLPGFALFAPAAIMFLLALQFGGNDYSWDSSVVIGLFVGAAVTAGLFIFWEHREGDEKAMVPMGLFKNRIVLTSSLVGALNMSITQVSSYYIPMYFQSVKGETPFRGGVHFLPTIIAQLVFAVASGALVGRMGYYLPWAVFGSVSSAIGNGLISTWDPSTDSAKWIGYQVLLGAGRGACMQMVRYAVMRLGKAKLIFTLLQHIIAVQANIPPATLSVSMAMLVFMQTFGGAIFLTAGEVIFSEGLGKNLAKYAPAVDVKTVLAAGGTGFRTVVPESDLPGVLVAYSKSIGEVFYLMIGIGGLAFVLSWGMGWVDIRKKKGEKKGDV